MEVAAKTAADPLRTEARCHDDRVIVAELLDTLAHGIPDLHGAACRGPAARCAVNTDYALPDRHERHRT